MKRLYSALRADWADFDPLLRSGIEARKKSWVQGSLASGRGPRGRSPLFVRNLSEIRFKTMVHVLFAAGGTGGHLFPALEIAEEMKANGVDCSFAAHGLSSSRFFPKERWKWCDIQAERPSFNPLRALPFLWKTLWSTKEACRLLEKIHPDIILGFGSYHTVPVLLAAVRKKIPLFLFEPNVFPGRVIGLFSRYAELTGICFETTRSRLRGKTELIRMPLMKSSVTPVDRLAALDRYGFSGEAPIIVAFGGSQGSSAINHMVLKALHLFERQKRPNLLLLCGEGQDQKELESMAQNLGVMAKVVPFDQEMAYAYTVGDVFVSRSGAGTVAELAAFHKPAICIPYPFSKDGHQLRNAEELVKGGRALIIEEASLNPERLCTDLFRLLRMMETKGMYLGDSGLPVKKQFSQVLLEWLRAKRGFHG